ncbi:hypothetical protein C446_07150 [Halobiforma nitratireducens JCM 10879]|uniref:Uncharacterized protein n=1 Tax=Halobiforma nitratireducens JCM 10879 TaxID=1227454 RepID=M0M959_9EURY|nr:hypothetical protein C446_07150 [Halobiforma nitratireducens JCM 10879]
MDATAVVEVAPNTSTVPIEPASPVQIPARFVSVGPVVVVVADEQSGKEQGLTRNRAADGGGVVRDRLPGESDGNGYRQETDENRNPQRLVGHAVVEVSKREHGR